MLRHFISFTSILLLLLSTACAGRPQSFSYSPRLNGASMMAANSYGGSGVINDSIIDPEYEKESFTDKTGYVILGLVIAGASVAAIALPIYFLVK